MDGARVLDLLALLESAGVTVWLDGGWCVDALLGSQTRPHDDLDLIARLTDVSELEAALAGVGYARVHGEPPSSFELVDAEGHQVDVHPVRFTSTGEAIYRMENGADWTYPRDSLAAVGSILGREVRCQTPEMQMLSHATGYAFDDAHRADVAALAERFDLPLPPYRSA
jgi:lincosamide nucleotidyltransferase A/C/D/E